MWYCVFLREGSIGESSVIVIMEIRFLEIFLSRFTSFPTVILEELGSNTHEIDIGVGATQSHQREK
jgi:hypothetical protein